MGDFVVEAEQFADQAAIDGLVRRAFAHHPEVADMVAAIRVSPRYRPGLALVARAGHQVVGFVMLSGTDLVDDAGTRREVLTLTPLAVLPEYERRGIGSALVRAAVEEADRRGKPLVVLEGSHRRGTGHGWDARADRHPVGLPTLGQPCRPWPLKQGGEAR